MQITRLAEYRWSDRQDKYIVTRLLSDKWTGDVLLLKGASSTQESLNQSQTNFYNQLTADYGQQFANQNAVLGALRSSLEPILKAGPNQYGFSQAETNNLNSTAIQGTGQQYANASKSLREIQAAQGGGNSVLPSGVAAQQQAALNSASANQASSELLGIQNAGYQQGYNQYQTALGGLSGVAGMYNPASYAGQATGAGSAAASEANTITQENNAASPWNVVGGLLGGAASAGLNAFTGGLGGAAGKAAASWL